MLFEVNHTNNEFQLIFSCLTSFHSTLKILPSRKYINFQDVNAMIIPKQVTLLYNIKYLPKLLSLKQQICPNTVIQSLTIK